VSCIDCSVIGGLAAGQLMAEPLLSVGYDVEEQEPIVSSLTAYIEAHGGGITVDDKILSTSVNPVQNKVIYGAFEYVRDYVTNVLGTQITNLINEKFKTLDELVAKYPAEAQEVGKSAIVYDVDGNAKFYTVKEEASVKTWEEVSTKESMFVSKTTDIDKMPDPEPLLFTAGISPVDSSKLEQLLSNYVEQNDHVPTSKLVKATAEQLSSMIVEGSGGAAEWIKDHFDADELSDVVVRNAFSAPSAYVDRLSAESLSAPSAYLSVVSVDGQFSCAGSSYFTGSVAAQSDLSVGFGSVLDTAEHQLSDMLRDLKDSAKVLAVCLRVNEIKALAALEDVPEIDYTKDKVEDLFNAVKKIAPHRPVLSNFQQLVSSLNMSLGELKSAQTGVSLETRLGMLSESVYAVADYTDSAIQGVKADVTYLSSQISSISPATEARLTSVEGRVSAIEGDYLKSADKASLQTQISLKVSSTDFENRLALEKKLFAQQAYNALSALPSDRQVLDVDTISKVLFDIRALFDGLKS